MCYAPITHASGKTEPSGKKRTTDWYDCRQLHIGWNGTVVTAVPLQMRYLAIWGNSTGMDFLLSSQRFCFGVTPDGICCSRGLSHVNNLHKPEDCHVYMYIPCSFPLAILPLTVLLLSYVIGWESTVSMQKKYVSCQLHIHVCRASWHGDYGLWLHGFMARWL